MSAIDSLGRVGEASRKFIGEQGRMRNCIGGADLLKNIAMKAR